MRDSDWRTALAIAVILFTLSCLVGMVAEGNALLERMLTLIQEQRRMALASIRRELAAATAEKAVDTPDA